MLLPADRRGELTGRALAPGAGAGHHGGMRVLLAAIRCPKGDIEANLAAHRALLAEAAAAGCALALFPEMSLTGSVDPVAHPEWLAGLDHPAIAALAGAAGETGVGACFGVAERSPGGAAHITQLFAADGHVKGDGEAGGVQRKRHLGEDEEAFTAATEPVIFSWRDRPWATRAATRAAWACGSPWRARPAPRSMRTSPASRRWSGRTARCPPASRTGAPGSWWQMSQGVSRRSMPSRAAA